MKTVMRKTYETVCELKIPAYEAFFRDCPDCFFKWISNSDTAAGVTPGILDAWPMVAGLCCCSFCRTSLDRPLTLP